MITRYNLGRYECYQAWNEHRHSGTGILDVSIQDSLTEGQVPFHPASIPALLTRSTPTITSYQEKQVWITALLQQQGCLIRTPVLSHSQDFHALLPLSLTLDCLFATHTPYFFCPSILPGKGFLCNYFFLVSSILPYLHPVLMVLIPLLGKLSFYRFSSESPMIPSSEWHVRLGSCSHPRGCHHLLGTIPTSCPVLTVFAVMLCPAKSGGFCVTFH